MDTSEQLMADSESFSSESVSQKKIMVVGCHAILHRGLVNLLNELKSTDAFEAKVDYKHAPAQIQKLKPDLVIVDIKMNEKQGLQLIRQLRKKQPDIPTLAFCIHCDPIYEERALKAGAKGYVSKAINEENLLKAVDSVLLGHTYMSSAFRSYLTKKIKNGQSMSAENPRENLTEREMEVFSLIGQGVGTREIAIKLSLSIKTVDSHKEHIKNKLSLNSYSELAKNASLWFESIS